MTLEPLGDSALVLALADDVDEAVLNRACAVASALREAALPGVVDVVPAFATVTVHYEIGHAGAYDAFTDRVLEVARRATGPLVRTASPRVVEIPVCYGGEYGPDLEDIARQAGMKIDATIEAHAAVEYRVEAIGFVPGFAYLGGLPRRLHFPRRATPRAWVPAGSVGIGGAQTGVYPLATPGGWNLIGRTPLKLFEAARTEPALLHAGDRVRFRTIGPEEYAAWK